MRRFPICCALLLASTAARAERVCDLEDRYFDDRLQDSEVVTIQGRIVETYDRDEDGNYSYDVKDSCGTAYILWDRPIACSGTITVTGKFDEETSDDEMAISLWVTRFSCQ